VTERLSATVTALAGELADRCLRSATRGDGATARQLLLSLANEGARDDLFLVAAAGVWAAYRLGENDELITDATQTARALLRSDLDDSERVLVASALALIGVRDLSDQPAVDLLNAAMSARRAEQHELALWAANQALARRTQLTLSHQTLALLTAAVVRREPDTVAEAYRLADQLPQDDQAARMAELLRDTLHPSGSFDLAEAGAAVRDSDRPKAALSLAEQIGAVREGADDELLAGLHETLLALAEPDIAVEQARRGLVRAVGHLRRRRRWGEVPSVARAGLDIVVDLLTVGTTASAANLLVELVEALADAGLSELVEVVSDELPAVAQARLSELASGDPLWPDLGECVAGLRDQATLMLRRQRVLSTGQMSVLSLYIQPPDSIAIKKTILDDEQSELVEALHSGAPASVTQITEAAVSELVAALTPASLMQEMTAGSVPSLVVVPDGPLWSVPWQAAALCASTQVCLTPSLSVYARLAPMPEVVRSVLAIIDADAPGASLVTEALRAAHDRGKLEIRFASKFDQTDEADLLLMFAHGGGTGLSFRTEVQSERIDAMSLARSVPAPVALIAACWSSAAPPVAFPINLPIAMLIGGASAVVGGLWPLPALATAAVVARTIELMAQDGRLLPALHTARDQAEDGVLERWGLTMYGAAPIALE
jgi:hypothetical protein